MDPVRLIENKAPMPAIRPSKAIATIYYPMYINTGYQIIMPDRDFGYKELLKKHHISTEELYRFSKTIHDLSAPENISLALKYWPMEFVARLEKMIKSLIWQDIDYQKFNNQFGFSFYSIFMESELFSGTSFSGNAVVNASNTYALAQFFKAEWYTKPIVFQQPDLSKYQVYTLQDRIPDIFQRVVTYSDNSRKPKHNPRKYTNTELKEISAMADIPEPFPASSGRTKYFAARAVISIASQFSQNEISDSFYIDILTGMLKSPYNDLLTLLTRTVYEMALPILSETRTFFEHLNGNLLIRHLTDLLYDATCDVESPENYKWLSTDDLLYRILQSNHSSIIQEVWTSYTSPSLDKYPQLEFSDIVDVIYPLLVKGLCSLLATMGLAEIAIAPIHKAGLHDVAMVRPTALLSYAKGLIQDYKPAATEPSGPVITLEPESYTIVSSNPNIFKIFAPIIERKLSPTRAIVSVSSLLSGCNNSEELDRQSTMLLNMANLKKLPVNWGRLFDTAKSKYITIVSQTISYSVFQIVKPDKRIRSLISRIPNIEKYLINAERNILIVPAHHRYSFLAALRNTGIVVKELF